MLSRPTTSGRTPRDLDQCRVYDGKPLRCTEAQRRAAVAKTVDAMRASPTYIECLRSLQDLALHKGLTRPTSSESGWGVQHKATMPGDAAESVAATAKDVKEQLKAAFAFEHPMASLASRLSPAQRAAVQWQCDTHRQHQSVHDARLKRFSEMARCAKALKGWSVTLGEHSPPWIQGGVPPRPHYALFLCCIEACDLPDAHLVTDLIVGAPCVGLCPDSGMFRKDWQPAAVHIDELDHEQWHRDVDKNLRAAAVKPSNRADLQSLYDRTMKEVKEGWATSLGSLEDARAFFGGRSWREMIRFAVVQNGLIRPCDNGRSSLHNLCTALFERLTVDSADFPARAAALFLELLGELVEFAFHLGTEDIASAYRRMPCAEPWFTVFAQWNPVKEFVEYFRLQGFNFGLKSAVNAFNRLSMCMREVANRILAICCSSYFDDFCVAEPMFSAGGQQLLRDMACLLGVPFAGQRLGEHKKSIRPATANAFTGVHHDFTAFARTKSSVACVSKALVLELADTISSVIGVGSFEGSAGPLKLAGQLQFTISWSCRRFGRAAIQPIHRMGQSSSRREQLDTVAIEALTFLRDLLVDPVSKEVRLRPRRFDYRRNSLPHAIVWSDACYEASADKPAGIGFVVFVPATAADRDAAAQLSPKAARRAAALHDAAWCDGQSMPEGEWYVASHQPPREMLLAWRERDQYVGQLELLAAIAVYYSLADVLRGRQVVHYIDNSGSMSILVKDYSSDIDSAQLVNTFYALVCALDIDVWFDYVRSAANIADWPSRGQLAFAELLCATPVTGDSLKFPKLGEWGSVALALEWANTSQSSASLDPPAKKRRLR